MGNIPPTQQLPEEEYRVLCELWDDLSQRCGGYIDRDVFLRLYNVPGLLGERLFEAFDVHHTGKISRSEFMNGTTFYIAGKTEEKIRVLWQLHDLHNDGGVTPEDLTVILSTLSTTDVLNSNSAEPVDAVHRQRRVNQIVCETFKKCNLCKDGLLHLDEFKLFLEQQPDIIGALENVVSWRDWNPDRVMEHEEAMERDHHTSKDLRLIRSISQSPTEQSVTFQGELYKIAGLLDTPPHTTKLKKRWAFLHRGFLYIFLKKRDRTPAHIIFLDGCAITEHSQARTSRLNKGKPAHIGFQIHASTKLMHTWFVPDKKLLHSWITSLRWAAHTLEFQDYYRLENEIGRGVSSIVYKGCHLVSGKYFAIKIIEKKNLRPDGQEGVRSEIAILKLIDHPHLLKLEELIESPERIYMVLDLYSYGDLFDRVVRKGAFPEETAKQLTWTLLDAIRYMHRRDIVHRDLKPENVMMRSPDNDVDVVVCDFGLSKIWNPCDMMNLSVGTLQYVAPEVLLGSGYDLEVDIWSLGCIMFVVMSGKFPFAGQTQAELAAAVTKGEVSFAAPVFDTISDQAKDLIKCMLRKDPKARVTAKEAIMHPWFAGIRAELGLNETRDRTSSAMYDQSPQSLLRRLGVLDSIDVGSSFALGSDDEEKTEPDLLSPRMTSRSEFTRSDAQTYSRSEQASSMTISRPASVMDVLVEQKQEQKQVEPVRTGRNSPQQSPPSTTRSHVASRLSSAAVSPVDDESIPFEKKDNETISRVMDNDYASLGIVAPTPRRKPQIQLESLMAEKLAEAFTEATIPAHLRQGSIDISVDVVAAITSGAALEPSPARAGGFVDVDAVVNAVALLEEEVAAGGDPRAWMEDTPRPDQEVLLSPLTHQKSLVVDADDLAPSRPISPPDDDVVDADLRTPSRGPVRLSVREPFPLIKPRSN